MARIRSIKPEFWLDRKLARTLSRDARMFYMGLWNQADEHGRAQADPRLLQGQIFPYEDDIDTADIEAMLGALANAGVVQLYESDGDPYLFLPKLGSHQRLEPSKVASKFPAPPEPAPDQPTPVRANESARDADQSEPDGNSSALLYVAGSMEHGSSPPGADESAPRRATERDTGFADFWDAYPRKIARPKALKAWKSALKRADRDTIMAGLAKFQFKSDPQFIPHPASWLNADRWADEPPQTRPAWEAVEGRAEWDF